MLFLAPRGYRCIAHGRRVRSSQPWHGNDMDTYADELAALVESLDLNDTIHVGYSTGVGEVARYIGRQGAKRIARAVLIGAVTPFMLKTPDKSDGTSMDAFDQIRAAVLAGRFQLFKDLTLQFHGYNRPSAKAILDSRRAITRAAHPLEHAASPGRTHKCTPVHVTMSADRNHTR
jgi:non-heme chloroperoxidase